MNKLVQKEKSKTKFISSEPEKSSEKSVVSDDKYLELYSKLNPAQKEAVDTTEGPVMVIAGAGTGKTQILAMRIANILRNEDLQMNPQNILCLTFTDSAVNAMRKRLISIIGNAAYYVKIHTFHSFCNEIIQDNPEVFLGALDFISELEQIQTFNKIIDSLSGTSPIKPYGDPYYYRYDLISKIKTLKREAISPEELEETTANLENFIQTNKSPIEDFISRHARSIKEADIESFISDLRTKDPVAQESKDGLEIGYIELIRQYQTSSKKSSEFKKQVKDFYEKSLKSIPKQKELAKVYSKYLDYLKTNSLYDFEDMILWVVRKFESEPELLAEYQEQFQYILLDEYQDTNEAQNRILELLTEFHGENANVFVVGDDDQSIYRFQGASVENVVRFYEKYKSNAKFVVLKENYRSQQTILDASYGLINKNLNRIESIIPELSKKLSSQGKEANHPVEIHELGNPNEEALFIADKVQELLADGTQASEIAVLYRNNKDSEALIDLFERLKINFKVDLGSNILEDIDISHLVDFLKLINNPQNSAILFNVLNYDFFLSSQSYRPIDIFRLCKRRDGTKTLIELMLEDEKFKTAGELILSLSQKSFNLKLDQFFEELLKETGFINYLMSKTNKLQKLNRLNTLFDQVKDAERYGLKNSERNTKQVKTTLKDFLGYLELLEENKIKIKENTLESKKDAVNLMTAHKSKGLEFEHVFVFKCTDKHWGNQRDIEKLKLPYGLIKRTESFTKDGNNEDERRLFYVALTRAKKKAYVSYAKEKENGKSTIPSIFIEELEDEHIIRHENLKSEESSKLSEDSFELGKIESFLKEKESSNSLKEEFLNDEEKQIIEKYLENYKLSVTHLNNFLKCARLFFYQNLIRVPQAKNKAASLGTAVHRALYELFSKLKYNEIPREKDLALKSLLESFEAALKEEYLDDIEYKDSLEFGKQELKAYFNHYKKEILENEHSETLLEYDFGSKGISLESLRLTGKLDKIEVLSDKGNISEEKDESFNKIRSVKISDYKTGNPSNKRDELKEGGDYHRQVVFYKLLIDLAREAKILPYKMQSSLIDFVQTDSSGKYSRKEITVSENELETLKNEINMVYSEIQAMNFEKTDDISNCERCSFKKLCWS